MRDLWGQLQIAKADLHVTIGRAGKLGGANEVLSAQVKELAEKLAEKPKCGTPIPALLPPQAPVLVPLVTSYCLEKT
jgi:hypothetical protein